MIPIEKLSAAAMGRHFSSGTLDPVEVTEFFLTRIAEDSNPIFITLTAERARMEAAASRKRYREGCALGPIDGVPVAWKDIVDFAGITTTAGSSILAQRGPCRNDAPIVANLAAAGAVAIGKTNLSEFAFTGLGLNPHFGSPYNPHDRTSRRIVGGSSSGSAAAVAAGLAPCAIGSDTGGSIRGPSAFCGIVGYKSSEGRIDKRGVFPLSRTLDTIGPMARTVEDCVLLDAALRGQITAEARRRPLGELVLVVPGRNGIDDADPIVAVNMAAALHRLEAAGGRIVHRELTLLKEMRDVTSGLGALITIEAYAEHAGLFESERSKEMDPNVVSRAMLGRDVRSRELILLQRERARLSAELNNELDGALLMVPGTPMTAPRMEPIEDDDEIFRTANLRAIYFSVIGNFFAMCGLSLPTGTDAAGLPTGIQLLAPGGHDDRLLSFGLEVERAIRSHDEPV
ncbi:hypothetical protein LQ948_11110 [Jiella sp. MQZ9-1]|uniref:Indoleacetamide hydrolase n=1 Tax=Jiella flava TaxID=2816857 RepID=A0A939JSP6_9HYPH|nr:amidase family protein [Jiella flava]MBO0663183.1 hypothetical protein [Jiella flava]MCD2471757.1 hypothetical protein [Jiella flava]